jgi:phosphatidylserine synthase
MYKSRRFLLAVRPQMDEIDQHGEALEATPARRAAAFSVHVFTALGAGVALLALLEAVREHWTAMFWWLGVALFIDALDGPLARRLDVVRLQPDWSGDVLDLVVDFVTYVFVPAYAITESGLLLPLAAPLLGAGIAVIHPVRVKRLRWLTLTLIALWAVLLAYTLLLDFDVGPAITVALCMIALYVVACDSAIRLLRSLKA